MKTSRKSLAKRLIAHALIALMTIDPAVAATITISSEPLASVSGSSILPNLLFVLDDSGSMDWDYLPDFIVDSGKCLIDNGDHTTCSYGDPPYQTGGTNGFNGVAYDPNVYYKPGLTYTGATVLTAPLTTSTVPNDAYGAQDTGTTNIATGITDRKYCNDNGICKRNGADDAGTTLVSGTDANGNAMSAGRFPYRTSSSNSSATIFALPETMPLGTFVRSSGSSTVTVTTVEPHGLATGNIIYTTDMSSSSMNVNAASVTVSNSTTFTYTSTSNTSQNVTGQYRKHVTGATWSHPTSGTSAVQRVVTVTSNNHGLSANDIVYMASGDTNSTGTFTITAVTTNTFTYSTTSTPGVASGTATWLRNGLYNTDSTTTGTPMSYFITPVEYCSDETLTNCIESQPSSSTFSRSGTTVTVTSTAHGLTTGGTITVQSAANSALVVTGAVVTVINANSFRYTTTSSGTIASTTGSWTGAAYVYPAYVRYCQTQTQAFAPGAVGDTSGTPKCRSKFVESGSTKWIYARYGVFNRDIIQSGTASYSNRPNRTDCTSAPVCTYAEEMQNYARWFTYYRTRMQMMKTAAGRSFSSFVSNPSATPAVANKLKVGFITINPNYTNGTGTHNSNVQSANYLKISAFDQTQAASWYSKFYAKKPANSTALQEALSRAGWIFAGKLNTGLTSGIPTADDPMDASCQRNFTLLTTDGYWNGNYGQDLSGSTGINADNVNNYTQSPYSSVMIDRTNTGTFDGGVGTVAVTSTPTTTTAQSVCYGSGNTSFPGGGSNTPCGCTGSDQRLITRTSISNQNVSATDGTITSTSNSGPTESFANTTACTAGVIATTDSTVTITEQQYVRGGALSTFGLVNGVSTGANNVGVCSGNQLRIKQRITTYTSRVLTTNGTAGTATITGVNYALSNPGSCQSLASTETYTTVDTQQKVYSENSPINANGWTAAANTGNPTDNSSFSCSGSGTRHITIQRDLTYTKTVTKNSSGTITGTSYSAGSSTASNFSIADSCSTSTHTAASSTVVDTLVSITATPAAAATVTDPGTPSLVSSTGTALTVTQSPNPSVAVVGSPTTTTTPGGYQDTLADVAMYYFRTDLRGGTDYKGHSTGPSLSLGGSGTVDVATNNVPAKTGAKDFPTHQHMITYTVGMADGLMKYKSDYETSSTGDFANVKSGTNNGCFWVTGTCNWPQPIGDDASALDDLWHAAVNGRGQFYSALNVDGLVSGISNTLTSVNAQVAAASASATSSPNLTQTDHQIFSTTYETNTWSGQVFSRSIDPSTGVVNPTVVWRAETQLLNKIAASSDTRTLWMLDTGTTPAASKLKSFAYASMTSTEQGWFNNKCSPSSTMTQCAGLTTTQTTTANDGVSLVNFLRGQIGNEATIFRDRTYIDPATSSVIQTVLGDTVSAKPAYVRSAVLNYADAVTPSYATFTTSVASRSARLYVGANDGYLHAFNGDTGDEVWAYAPRFLMSNLYRLADTGYSTAHRYYVDGSPETADVYDTTASTWKTILVGGAASGGRGFYAIDVTDANNPKGLWEFCNDSTICANSDVDLGLSYGNPIIGKRSYDGKWVVILNSGLNNVSSGSGIGYFYVLDAITGAVLNKISTATGSAGTPSGLMKMAAHFDNATTDATFRYVYGGDQLGNVWRLDMNTATPSLLHITTLKDGSSPARAQPITTKPIITLINNQRALFIGTGRFIGSPDLSDPGAASGISWQQSLYAFRDRDTDYSATYSSLRADTRMVVDTLSVNSNGQRSITQNTVDWTLKSGWYVDFNPSLSGVQQSAGEGVNLVDPELVKGALLVVTNAPTSGSSSCSVAGSSFVYDLDYLTGKALGDYAGYPLGASITVGIVVNQTSDGTIVTNTTSSTGDLSPFTPTLASDGTGFKTFSYRVR